MDTDCFVKSEEKKLDTSVKFSTEVEERKSTKLSTFTLYPTEKFTKGYSDPNFSYLLSRIRGRLSDRNFSASERKEKRRGDLDLLELRIVSSREETRRELDNLEEKKDVDCYNDRIPIIFSGTGIVELGISALKGRSFDDKKTESPSFVERSENDSWDIYRILYIISEDIILIL